MATIEEKLAALRAKKEKGKLGGGEGVVAVLRDVTREREDARAALES